MLALPLIEPGFAGLQVERDEGWFDVPPVEDAFLVTIGELLDLPPELAARARGVTQDAQKVMGSR